MTGADKKTDRNVLPWADLMTAGLGRLGLSPSVFWGMTLQELDAALVGALGIGSGDGLPDRADLTALMMEFPDMTRGADDE